MLYPFYAFQSLRKKDQERMLEEPIKLWVIAWDGLAYLERGGD